MDDSAMTTKSTTVHVRGHDFTVDFRIRKDGFPDILRIEVPEYGEDMKETFSGSIIRAIRDACLKRHQEELAYIQRSIELERMEP